MDIEKIVQKELKKIIENGVIEAEIQKVLTESMKDIIETSMGKWSEFGKALKEKISESLAFDVKDISIPEYSSKILAYITDEMDLQLKNKTEKILKDRIKEFFKPLEKDEYTVTDIVEAYKDNIKWSYTDEYDNVRESHEFTAFVDKSSNKDEYFDLYLDETAGKSRYQCDYMIRCNSEGIWHIRRGYEELHKVKTEILNTFERYLFMMFSQKVKITDDSDRIDNWIASDFD